MGGDEVGKRETKNKAILRNPKALKLSRRDSMGESLRDWRYMYHL